MSWRVANECAERRFGSAARKQIIMFRADKASEVDKALEGLTAKAPEP